MLKNLSLAFEKSSEVTLIMRVLENANGLNERLRSFCLRSVSKAAYVQTKPVDM